MNNFVIRLLMTLAALLLITASALGQASAYPTSPLVHEFGYVGIDFLVYHTAYIVNSTDDTVAVKKLYYKCECNRITEYDSLIPPQDTGFFRIEFNTKDYYGPIQRSLKITLDDDQETTFEFSHRAVVGQWFKGLKPNPVSLFFLPRHKSKQLEIPNVRHPKLEFELHERADTTFDVRLIEDSARRGKSLIAEITPKEGLAPGTYNTSVTMMVSIEDVQLPALMTFPIKIVRYR